MIIHFIASKASIKTDYHNFKAIIDAVKDLGHVIARDWVEEEYNLLSQGKSHKEIDWQSVNLENIAALSRADVVIAEATARSFSVGFQVATAIQQKKPVLILARGDAFDNSFGSGISSDFVKQATYTDEDVRDTVSDFINENNIENKDLRFNFFIDRQIYNYLRWAAYKTGKNKSEILRELVLREIEKREE